MEELAASCDLAASTSAKRKIKKELALLEKEIKDRFGKDEPKISKKTSLAMTLFNKALRQSGVKRENHWSGTFTGNNVKKILDNTSKIFQDFATLFESYYKCECSAADHTGSNSNCCRLASILLRFNDYKLLLQKYYAAYRSVNHGNRVDEKDCDTAQKHIDDYLEMVHQTFKWSTTANKAHYLQERAVPMMRKRGIGLSLFSEQGMESANQARKKTAKRTRHMSKLQGLKTDAMRLMVDKSKSGQLALRGDDLSSEQPQQQQN